VQEVRSHCCEAILDSYSKIRLLDDTRIDVDLLYVDVYVLEKLSSKRYASISGLLEGVEQREDYERLALGQRQKRLPGQEIVQQFLRLMVLGKPGSGKTTFLRHLAVDCSKGKFFCDHIPVLIELRSIKQGNSFNLLNLIHREFGLAQQEQTQQILNQGKAFILLDGLDEVPSQLRQSVRDQIYEFSKEYRKNRFILTCRTQTIEYIADHFDPIEVANFDAEQVKTFARNWFTATPETSGEAEGWTNRFVGKLEENKQIRELAVTPILLTLTCLLFTAEQDLPTKRSVLYEKGIDLLLKQWDRFRGIPRDYQQLSVLAKQKLLSYLAFHKFEQPENFILFEQDEIQGYIAEHLGIDVEESEALLEAIEAHHGLLIEQAQGIWSFSHLTFQEYFTAKYIVNSSTPEEAFQHLVKHITELRWREVFLLTIGMLQNAEHLLQLMKQQVDALIAANEKVQQFLRWVSHRAISVETSYNPVFVRALCLNPGRDGVFIPSDVRNLDLSLSFDFDRIRDVESLLTLAHNLDCIYYLAHACTSTLAFDDYFLATNRIIHSCFDISYVSRNVSDHMRGFNRKLQSDQGERMRRDSLLTYQFKYEQSMHDHAPMTSELFYAIRRLTHDLTHKLTSVLTRYFGNDLELKQKLQELKNQLPDLHSDTYKWWQEQGQSWTKELKLTIVKHCNNGRDWVFSPQQKELLNQYYDANRLLVDCLNSDCNASPEVKEEIEETLLLPVTEIEKHKQLNR